MGGNFHPKLNIYERPIVNKYRKGKMKSTLKRESKELETAKIEGMGTSPMPVFVQWGWVR